MAVNPSMANPALAREDTSLDLTLRPKTWKEYVGQEKVTKNLKVLLEAAKQRRESPEHLLFYGNSGLGKTTLAHVVANEIQAPLRVTSGPAIEKAGDLAAILTNLADNSVLFIDEIHRLSKPLEEYLYSALEDFKLHLILGKGPMARTMSLDLPRFTLIGATTRAALLSSPLRGRFGAVFQLSFYSEQDLEMILERSAFLLGVTTEPKAIAAIAKRSRLTPRVANRLLKRVRDFAQVEGDGIITEAIADKALEFLGIDDKGLETNDGRILETMIKKFDGGPVGLQALAAASSEEEGAILDIYEPYLMQLGFIERTPRGRMATKLAYQHLGIKYQKDQHILL